LDALVADGVIEMDHVIPLIAYLNPSRCDSCVQLEGASGPGPGGECEVQGAKPSVKLDAFSQDPDVRHPTQAGVRLSLGEADRTGMNWGIHAMCHTRIHAMCHTRLHLKKV
jgi:hypothetical protein